MRLGTMALPVVYHSTCARSRFIRLITKGEEMFAIMK
jgi:hypothetical protein